MPGISESTKKGIILRSEWRKESQEVAEDAGEVLSAASLPEGKQHTVDDCVEHAAHTREPRPKACIYEKPAAIRAAVERAKAAGIVHLLPPLGRYRFESFDEFNAFVIAYFARNLAGYRRRSSFSTWARNKKLREDGHQPTAEGTPVNPAAAYLGFLPWDSKKVKYMIAYWCVHGCTQRGRGKEGGRIICSTKYTGCTARVTGQLKSEAGPNGEIVWFIEVQNEIATHNHTISEAVYKTYNTTAFILTDAELFKKVAWGVEIGGDPRLIRDVVSRETNSTYSQRKYDNLTRYWLGGAPVMKSVQDLLEAFAALPGSRCLVIKDDDGVLAGIVMQSSAQRALVQACGDTLVLDWTHNTNNRGFHLGALVATTTNGTGVSVLDFLCISQSSKMMETVFDFFIAHNPGVKEKIKSVVIDKDYTEWSTILKMFQTMVVLCIFHVLKWFKWVIAQAKYSIGVASREAVLACLTAMVYAVSLDALEAQKTKLRHLLNPDTNAGHQAFVAYMERNWYPHTGMWSYAERGCVFTAGNTTSNRIESWWNQFKATLGARRRLDLCIEAIFQHATVVLRREEDLLATHLAKTQLHEQADDKLRPLLMELSSYAAVRVERQWTKYVARRQKFSIIQQAGCRHGLYTVRFSGVHDVDSCVDTSDWTCSCRFFRGIQLPCRHLFFVAHEELRLPVYPVIAIARRWRMSEAVSLLPTISRSVKELEQLRAGLIRRANRTAADDNASSPASRFSIPRAIAHLNLRKNEISDSRVLLELEQRNLCEAATEPLIAFATKLPTPQFKMFVHEVVGTLAELVARWQTKLPPQGLLQQDATEDKPAGIVQNVKSADTPPASVQAEVEQAAWRACRASVDNDCDRAWEDDDEETLLCAVTPVPNSASKPLAIGACGRASLSDAVEDERIDEAIQHAMLDQLIAAAAEADRSYSDLNGLADALHPPKRRMEEEDAMEVPNGKRRRTETVDQGLLAGMTLPVEVNKGTRKTAKQQSRGSRPLATVAQTGGACPVDVFQHNMMVRYSAPTAAAALQDRMPRILTESTVLRRRATAYFTSFQPRTLQQANAVVPARVLETLLAAVSNKRVEDGAETYVSGARVGEELWAPQYVAKIGSLREFPEELLQQFAQFYELESKLAVYASDMAWVSGEWEVPDTPQRVPFLQAEADEVEGAQGTFESTKMRAEIKCAYESTVLAASLTLPPGTPAVTGHRSSIPLVDLIGRVAFRQKLNDSVVNFALQLLASMYSDAVVVDSLSVDKIRVPQASLCATRLVCFPLHYRGDHWCILFLVRDGTSWRVWGYDPLVQQEVHTFMGNKWLEWCRPLIAAWNARDQRRSQVVSADIVDVTGAQQIEPVLGLEELEVTAVLHPKQPDGTSCGLFCVAQAADYMTHKYRFQIRKDIEPFTVALTRLRLMWLLLCKSTIVVDPEEQARARVYKNSFASYRP